MDIESIVGLSVSELTEVRKKLQVAGLNLKDIQEFLDRDKVQLFAEMRQEIKALNRKLEEVRKASA